MKGLLPVVLSAAVLLISTAAWAQGTAPAAPSSAAPPPASAAKNAAPAQAPVVVPEWMKYKPYTGEENDIANPHRTADEITAWGQQAAADVMSFSREEQADKVPGFKKYFSQQGWQLYLTYLKDSKILDMVNKQGYFLTTIVSRSPEIVNRGATGGVYHWILKMPITLSFFIKDPSSREPKAGPSGKFDLFMDIARVKEGGGEDGIAIVNWRVMDVKP